MEKPLGAIKGFRTIAQRHFNMYCRLVELGIAPPTFQSVDLFYLPCNSSRTEHTHDSNCEFCFSAKLKSTSYKTSVGTRVIYDTRKWRNRWCDLLLCKYALWNFSVETITKAQVWWWNEVAPHGIVGDNHNCWWKRIMCSIMREQYKWRQTKKSG